MRRASSGFVHTLTRYRSVIFASLIALFDFARRISFRHNHNMRTSLQASATYLHSFMLMAHRLLNTHTPRTSCKRRPSRSPCSAVAPVLACATSGLLAPALQAIKRTDPQQPVQSTYLALVLAMSGRMMHSAARARVGAGPDPAGHRRR